MYSLFSLIWALTGIGFVFFYFKKRSARKNAGDNYKTDELYLKASKIKRILGIVCILSFVGCAFTAPEVEKKDVAKPVKVEQEVASKTEEKEDAVVEEKAEEQPVQADVKEKITDVCKEVLDDDLVEVSVNDSYAEGEEGTKIVLVTGKIKEGFSDSTTKKSNLNQAGKVFKALYNSGQPISTVVYFVEADFVDAYGKESKSNAFKFTMNKATADKIAWDNLDRVDLEKILDDVWMIPQFRNVK